MDLHHLLHVEGAWNCTRAGGNCFTALLVAIDASATGAMRDFWMESLKDEDLRAWSFRMLEILPLFVQTQLHLLQLTDLFFC